MIQIKMFYFRDTNAREVSAEVNDWLSRNRDVIDVYDIRHTAYCTPHEHILSAIQIMIVYRTSKGETLND